MGSAKAPQPSAEERALQKSQAELLAEQRAILKAQQQQQKVLLPFLAEQEGYKVETDEDGNITGISRIPDETETLRKTLDKELAERSLAALRGELPVDPNLEKSLKKQDETLRERLAKQFGPGYETSTAGIQTLGELFTNQEGLRASARRGELTLSEQLGLAREQQNDFSRQSSQDFLRQIGVGDPMTIAGGYGQVAGGHGAAVAPYVANRQMQFNASQANASSRWGLLGSLVGAAGSVAASPAGGAFLFSDDRLKSDAVPISMHPSGIPIYTYTIGGERRIGVMASDVARIKPELVGSRYGYNTVDYEGI